MTRLFLPLFLLMLTFTLALIFGIEPTIDYLLKGRIYQYLEITTQSPFILLKEKLDQLPSSKHLTFLEQHNQEQQGYPMIILEDGDTLLDEKSWKKIKQGEMQAVLIDEADYAFRWIAKSRLAIGLTFDSQLKDVVHREGIQTFNLIIDRLKPISPEHWPNEINRLNELLPVHLELSSIQQTELDEEQRQQLSNGKIVRTITEKDVEFYYGQIANSNTIIVAGPIPPIINQRNLLISFIVVVTLLLSLSILIWIRPLWKSISVLKRTSQHLGSGDMDARANIKQNALLGDLAFQFNAMAAQIQKLVNGHRDLTNAVSHELRTPIARMRFGMEMLTRSDDEKNRERYITGLNDDVDELENLVDEILTYARFEANSPTETWEDCFLKIWLEDIIQTSQRFTDNKALVSKLDNLMPSFQIRIRSRSLQRAIENILRNASLYANNQIMVSAELSKSETQIHIDDDGPGIPIDKREEIFIVFSRLEKSRDKKTGGYGLGLAIANQCIKSMAGDIIIGDSPLGGARFTIKLPITTQ